MKELERKEVNNDSLSEHDDIFIDGDYKVDEMGFRVIEYDVTEEKREERKLYFDSKFGNLLRESGMLPKVSIGDMPDPLIRNILMYFLIGIAIFFLAIYLGVSDSSWSKFFLMSGLSAFFLLTSLALYLTGRNSQYYAIKGNVLSYYNTDKNVVDTLTGVKDERYEISVLYNDNELIFEHIGEFKANEGDPITLLVPLDAKFSSHENGKKISNVYGFLLTHDLSSRKKLTEKGNIKDIIE